MTGVIKRSLDDDDLEDVPDDWEAEVGGDAEASANNEGDDVETLYVSIVPIISYFVRYLVTVSDSFYALPSSFYVPSCLQRNDLERSALCVPLMWLLAT
jgi:hypothetical protein